MTALKLHHIYGDKYDCQTCFDNHELRNTRGCFARKDENGKWIDGNQEGKLFPADPHSPGTKIPKCPSRIMLDNGRDIALAQQIYTSHKNGLPFSQPLYNDEPDVVHQVVSTFYQFENWVHETESAKAKKEAQKKTSTPKRRGR